MADLDLNRFEALTFDCYGTLIDWEAGILTALDAVLAPRGVAAGDDELLETYAGHEADAEGGAYLPYREVLARSCRGVCDRYGVEPTADEVRRFSRSVGAWPAFPDSAAALARLAQRFRLGVITNCDDDLFALSNQRLGAPFTWVVTAQQARSYKPSPRSFELAFEVLGLPRDRILHVAQSLFHDHVRPGASAWRRPGSIDATPGAASAPPRPPRRRRTSPRATWRPSPRLRWRKLNRAPYHRRLRVQIRGLPKVRPAECFIKTLLAE